MTLVAFTRREQTPQNLLNDLLIEAARDGDVQRVEHLVKDGAQVDYFNEGMNTAFHCASNINNDETRAVLLSLGSDINAKDEMGWTSLHMETMNTDGEQHLVWLLNHGAQVDSCDNNGRTPLCLAAGINRHFMVQMLLEHGANIDRTDDNGVSLLGRPGYIENESMCWRLVANGLRTEGFEAESPAAQNAWQMTPLQAGACLGDTKLMVKILESDPSPDTLPQRVQQAMGMPGAHEDSLVVMRSWNARASAQDSMSEILNLRKFASWQTK